jgi:hypothetical protein
VKSYQVVEHTRIVRYAGLFASLLPHALRLITVLSSRSNAASVEQVTGWTTGEP